MPAYREKWVSDCGTVTLYLGDCLDILPTLEPGSVDAVVTDPPYMIGANSTGSESAKCGTWMDMVNAAVWFREWIGESRKLLRDTGYLSLCCNWRTIPTLVCAFSRLSWAVTSCVVWDKQWIGPAYVNAFRPTYELALVAAMPNGRIDDRSASDLFRGEKWMAGNSRITDHPAEKPVDFMSYLIGNLSPIGGIVLDPFMGSATTCIASLAIGRQFVGVEGDDRHWLPLIDRVRDELNRHPLLEKPRRLVPQELFGAANP